MLQPDVLQKIQAKLDSQKKDSLARIQELEQTDPFNLESQTDVNDDRTSPDDAAQLNEAHERVTAQIMVLKNIISRIDLTVERIEKGTYGICEVCGNTIEESRLSIMPLASLCMNDERETEKRIKRTV